MLAFFGLALFAPGRLWSIVNWASGPVRGYQLGWSFYMLGTVWLLIPAFSLRVSSGKLFLRHFRPSVTADRREAVFASTRKANRAALRAAAFWIGILSLVGALHFFVFKGALFILMTVVFFYFFDEFCINVWCPFRAWIVRSKCCHTCRIHSWGRFMIVSPLLFLPSFWSCSLVAASLIVLGQWEYLHSRHPERFSEISNRNLQCRECTSPTCDYLWPGAGRRPSRAGSR